jgi:hypothetical protein
MRVSFKVGSGDDARGDLPSQAASRRLLPSPAVAADW